MAFADPKLVNFSLRGSRINDLRALAARYLPGSDTEITEMSKTDLVSQLSEAAANSKELAKELRKGSISLKPSFYLVRFSDEPKVKLKAAKNHLSRFLQQHSVGLHNLKVQLVEEPKSDVFQILFTWESSLNYWAPTFELAQVNQLQFGFSILDFTVRKGIVCCHTQRERDELAKVLAAGFAVRFSNLALTKPLLEQIGSFDSVKRALYVLGKADSTTPANITYADDNLAARSLARDEEENPRSQRAQSFYRICDHRSFSRRGGRGYIGERKALDSERDSTPGCSGLLHRFIGQGIGHPGQTNQERRDRSCFVDVQVR
jgi:hypothetical protein